MLCILRGLYRCGKALTAGKLRVILLPEMGVCTAWSPASRVPGGCTASGGTSQSFMPQCRSPSCKDASVSSMET